MYHWISPDPGERLRHWGVTPDQFETQMRFLHEQDYRVLSLGEVLEVVRGRREAPPRAVALTFDDGYTDFLEQAWPVLERYGQPATVFLVAERVGKVNSWDLRHGDPPRRLLSWGQAAELAVRGVEFGSHTLTHPQLPRLDDREQEREIRESREIIEDRLGRRVRFFCYPHGLYDDRCLPRVREAGYEAAVSDIRGANQAGTDALLLRRSLVTCHDSRWSFAFKLMTGFGPREWVAGKLAEWRPPAGILGEHAA